jgi:hypothetical protein
MTVIGVIERPRDVAAGPMGAALVAIDKLAECVADETRALRERGAVDLERFTHQKNYGLLEVTRAMRGIAPGAPNPTLLARLKILRERLEENRRVLGLHLKAAEEIADLVSGTLEEAASDGTYSAQVMRGRGR